jgi:transcriptional regulator with XRE-family HTH domain
MINVKKQLGKRISELRRALKISQEKLAEIIGIEPNNVSKIETGKNYPSPENLAKIALAFQVNVNELFVFDHHKEYNEIKNELLHIIDKDEKTARLLYKFYLTIKM